MQKRGLLLNLSGIFLSLVLLGGTSPLHATIVLSNLGESTLNASNLGVNSVTSYAESFTTGPSANGFLVSSVSILGSLGNDPGASLTIYANSGDDPTNATRFALTFQSQTSSSSGAILTYVPTSSLTLAGSTTYWLGLSTTTANPTSPEAWTATRSPSFLSNEGWTLGVGNLAVSNNQGGSWVNGPVFSPMLSITASDIPEPSTWILLLLGLGGMWAFRLRRPVNVEP